MIKSKRCFNQGAFSFRAKFRLSQSRSSTSTSSTSSFKEECIENEARISSTLCFSLDSLSPSIHSQRSEQAAGLTFRLDRHFHLSFCLSTSIFSSKLFIQGHSMGQVLSSHCRKETVPLLCRIPSFQTAIDRSLV